MISLDRMFGRCLIMQHPEESDEDYKIRIISQEDDLSYFYDHVNKLQEKSIKKSINKLIQGYHKTGMDKRKARKMLRKSGMI